MKKLFQILGIVFIIFAGFIYTEKTIMVVREYDEIMIKIKEVSKEKKVEGTDAIIKNDTIIPGIAGREININKSYNTMKQYGKYDEELLVYDKVKPKVSLEDNKDKYIISGNSSKQKISIVFINCEKYLDNILNYKINTNIFLTELPKNSINKLDNVLIGFYNSYDDVLNTTVRSTLSKEIKYCFSTDKKDCFKKNLYVIKTDIIESNYLIETKKRLTNGSIIVYKTNNELFNELNLIIKYINNKGYTIEFLDTLLEE